MRPPLRSLPVLVLGLLPALYGGAEETSATLQATPAPAAKAADVKTFDVNDCKTCHEPAFSSSFLHSKHAGVEQSCQSCHAGAADHARVRMEGTEDKPPSVKALKPPEVNKTCLACHDSGHQANWTGSLHDRRNVSCISCHSVHDFKSLRANLKTSLEADTCYTCHQAIRAKGLRTSHHPVREGKIGCASCHNPHDSTTPKMVSANWVNEKCLECHTEKRGPFLWEHAPVRENCLNCHDPHGSNHDKLLVAKQPFLCQRCHLNTRHPGSLYDGINALTGTSVSNRAIEHACKNCHQNVHGSNAPSGPYLGR
jgi:DmsE family decaheme c-type cytochrome